MCGIAGIFNLGKLAPPSLEQITAMLSPIRYRGPDESGVYLDRFIALGHVRLSIIGIDDGIQPICNEDHTLWIVYNGEIFNYVELRKDLLEKGHLFRTATDTEVLLHLYEEYGPACLDKINGQASIAIWNSANRELFLARDRLGIRPLYYALSGNRLIFASEIKAIQAVDGAGEIDLESLAQVFMFWTTISGRTVFKNVRELHPGHYMLVKDGRVKQQPYWSLPFHPKERMDRSSFQESAEQLHELVKDSVRLRLRADVPVGAYLSGGLDSSIITTVSSGFNRSLTTFSVGFREGDFDETRFQQQLIDSLGVEHHRVMIDNPTIRKFLPMTVWHCEKPLLRTAPVPLLALSGLVQAENFKVVLSGEGADEMLGGYNIFKEAKVRHFWGRQPGSASRPLLLERLYPYVFKNPSRDRFFLQKFFAVKENDLDHPFFSHMVRWGNSRKNLTFLSDDAQAALSGYDPLDELAELLPGRFYDRDLVSRAQALEIEVFLSNYLLSSQGDRVAMANSVELRHPFLDYRVVDYAFGLPSRWKIRGLNEKYILKRAFAGLLPDAITNRPKQPYRAPIQELFSPDAPRDYMDDLLSEQSLRRTGYFNPAKVGRLLERYGRNTVAGATEFQNMALIGILTTQILHHQFIEGHHPRAPGEISPGRVVTGEFSP